MPVPVPLPPPPGLQVTSLNIIQKAYRLIGFLAVEETLPSAYAQEGLEILNQMVDSWNSESLTIYNIARQVFTLNPNQQTYQMGSGAPDFNVPRPPKITAAGIISLNNPAQPLELPMDMLTTDRWAQIPVKNITSTLPLELYDDNQFPYRGINFWPIPSATVDVALYTWSALSQFTDLGATLYSFPPGYLQAIRYNLACLLATDGYQPSQLVMELALSTKAGIKSSNGQVVDLRCDTALVNPRSVQYDWRSDTPAGPR
jgi:hypothetical protein